MEGRSEEGVQRVRKDGREEGREGEKSWGGGLLEKLHTSGLRPGGSKSIGQDL